MLINGCKKRISGVNTSINALIRANSEIEELREIQKGALIQIIAADAQKIPASNYEDNLFEYRRLLRLAPENKNFQAKVEYYKKHEAEAQALRKVSTEDLCFNKSESAVVELKRRGTFTPAEWVLIDERRFRLGSSSDLLACSWGRPKKINRSVGKYGVHRQWVYGSTYVYTENGVITSWQD